MNPTGSSEALPSLAPGGPGSAPPGAGRARRVGSVGSRSHLAVLGATFDFLRIDDAVALADYRVRGPLRHPPS